MSFQDPIADMLTRIRNGQKAGLSEVAMPASRLKKVILKVLKDEGYITDFSMANEDTHKPQIKVTLKYHHGKPVIELIKRISKPGLRRYCGKDEMPKVMDGLGIAIISTPKGIMTGDAARKLGQGGEVLCHVA